MRRLLRAFIWLIGLSATAYVYFFVSVGRGTLWEHTQRIAATEQAQDLKSDLDDARKQWEDRARAEWQARQPQ